MFERHCCAMLLGVGVMGKIEFVIDAILADIYSELPMIDQTSV